MIIIENDVTCVCHKRKIISTSNLAMKPDFRHWNNPMILIKIKTISFKLTFDRNTREKLDHFIFKLPHRIIIKLLGALINFRRMSEPQK